MLRAAGSSCRASSYLVHLSGTGSPGTHHSFPLILCIVLVYNTASHIALASDCGGSPSLCLYICPSLSVVCVCVCIHTFACFSVLTNDGRQGGISAET